MNIRKLMDFTEGYYKINREERNLAAILYHLLLLDNNLKSFLKLINCTFPIIESEKGIYFEYAFLRDLWFNIEKDNGFKQKLILDLLDPINRLELEGKDIYGFNEYFGAVPTPSSKEIQSPSNWSIEHYNNNIEDNDEFVKVCEFKWCFNAKPDLVIQTSNNTAICIEAKFESMEGKYPSKKSEKEIFNRRGKPYVGQLSIQKKLMEDLLGLQTDFIFLVQNKSETKTHKSYTWYEVFESLDTSDCPAFIKEWIKRLDNNVKMK